MASSQPKDIFALRKLDLNLENHREDSVWKHDFPATTFASQVFATLEAKSQKPRITTMHLLQLVFSGIRLHSPVKCSYIKSLT